MTFLRRLCGRQSVNSSKKSLHRPDFDGAMWADIKRWCNFSWIISPSLCSNKCKATKRSLHKFTMVLEIWHDYRLEKMARVCLRNKEQGWRWTLWNWQEWRSSICNLQRSGQTTWRWLPTTRSIQRLGGAEAFRLFFPAFARDETHIQLCVLPQVALRVYIKIVKDFVQWKTIQLLRKTSSLFTLSSGAIENQALIFLV